MMILSAGFCSIKAQDSTRILTPSVTDRGRLNLATEDSRFTWKFDTRVYLDAAAYSSEQTLADLTYSGSAFRFSNGVSPRKIRFGVKTTFDKNWMGEFDVDFVYNEIEVKDLFVGYNFNDHLRFKIGNFKEPFSLENNTSSRYLQFMERAMVVNAFSPDRSLGTSLTYYSNHLYAAGGVFGQTIDLGQKTANRGNDGYAGTARVALIPINAKRQTLHVGVSATYRTPSSNSTDDRSVEFRTMPESYVNRMRFVDATISNVNHHSVVAAELAYRYNKFLFQGEYFLTTVSRYKYDSAKSKVNLKDAQFDGWYANATYQIWGGNKHYEESKASFESGKVAGKKGSLDLGLRYSYINMNDFHETSSSQYWITGGKSKIATAQINWAPNNNVKFSASYSLVDNDKWADADGKIKCATGQELNEGLAGGLDFNIIQLRMTGLF